MVAARLMLPSITLARTALTKMEMVVLSKFSTLPALRSSTKGSKSRAAFLASPESSRIWPSKSRVSACCGLRGLSFSTTWNRCRLCSTSLRALS